MSTKAKTYLAHAVGRRKNSIARVYVSNGTGKITINNRTLADYFPIATSRYIVNQPLSLTQSADKYDFNVNVVGGGFTGQAGAIRLGIARIMLKLSPATRSDLKAAGFLTRDSREVERKKYGKSGARKSYQFSKR